MNAVAQRLKQLRESSPREAAKLVYRKAIFRKVVMGRYGYLASEAVAPARALRHSIEIWGPDRYDAVLRTNEYLNEGDLEAFHRQRSKCIVVLDGDTIAASSWMTGGDVFVHELGRSVEVPIGEHFSCRSYVSPDYRGLSLLSHMIYAYTQQVDPTDEIWGLVYAWNTASIKSLANIGWKYSGEYWTQHLLGRQTGGHQRCDPREAFDGDDVFVL